MATTSSNVLGTVTSVVGEVKATASDGTVRILQVGDRVFSDEVITTSAAGAVDIGLEGGRVLQCGNDANLTLNESMLGIAVAAAPTPAPAAPAQDVAALQAAIAAGADPTQVAEATAAGAPGAGGADGSGGTPVVINQANLFGQVTSGFHTSGSGHLLFPGLADHPLVAGQPVVSLSVHAQVSVQEPSGPATLPPGALVSVTPGAVPVIEGTDHGAPNTVNFVVTLDKPFTSDVLVSYTVVPGPGDAAHSAQPGSDYVATSPDTVTIPAGQTEVVVPVQIVQDAIIENNENFTIVLTDAVNATIDPNASTVVVTIVDDDLLAVADTNSVKEDTKVTTTGSVITNDLDTSSDTVALSVNAVNGSAANVGHAIAGTYGTLTLNADGTYTYALNNASPAIQGLGENQTVTDTFNYTVVNGFNNTSSAKLTITISGTDDAPVANNDSYTTAQGTTLTVAAGSGVLVNDSDIDTPHDQLKAILVNGPAHGTLSLSADGGFVYTPGAGFSGSDSFTYKANDGSLDSNVATANITVTAVAAPPPPVNQAPVVATGSAVTVSEEVLPNVGNNDALGTGSDPNGDNDMLIDHGSFKITDVDNNAWTVTLSKVGIPALTSGGQTIVWTGDGTSALVGHAGSEKGATVITIAVDNPSVTGTSGSGTANYTVTLSGPLDHASGAGENLVTFNVGASAKDGSGGTTSTTFAVNVEDDTPVANADTASALSGQTIHGNVVLGDDFGGVADKLSADGAATGGAVTAVTGHGAATTGSDENGNFFTVEGSSGTLMKLYTDGRYTYTTDSNLPQQQSEDSFNYTITDADGDTATATLTITLNDAGLVAAPDADVTVNESALPDIGSTGAGTVTAPGALADNVTDQADPTGPFTYALLDDKGNRFTTLDGAHGTITLNPEDGTYSYTLKSPVINGGDTEVGDSFKYQVTDALGNTTTSTITVNVVDDVPTASKVTSDSSEPENSGAHDLGVAMTVLGANAGADGLKSLVISNSGAGTAGGTLSIDGNGDLIYTAPQHVDNTNGAVADSFTYTVTDGDNDTATGSFTVNVTDTGVTGASATGEQAEGSTKTYTPPTGSSVDTPVTVVDGSYTGSLGTVVTVSGGQFSYTAPVVDESKTPSESFTFKITDSDSSTGTSSMVITINDSVPTANADAATVIEGHTISGNVVLGDKLGGVADTLGADGAAAGGPVTAVSFNNVAGTVGSVVHGAFGDLTLKADGSYSYAAKPNMTGTDVFSYTITDGDGSTSNTTLTIKVNDAFLTASLDDTVKVNESALPNGTGGGTATASGTLADNVSGGQGPYTYALLDANNNPVTTITTTHGVISLNADTGAYTYTLTAPLSVSGAGANVVDPGDSFKYQVTDDGFGNTATSTIQIAIVDDVPVLNVNNAFEHDVSGVTFTGNLVKMGADVSGAAITLSGTPPAGLTSLGVAVTYDTSVPGVLTAKAGADTVFTITTDAAHGTYTFNGSLPIDLTVTNTLNSSSLGAGPQPAFFIYPDGSLSSNGSLPGGFAVQISGTDSHGNPSTINPSTNGIGIGNNLVDPGETLKLDFDNSGSSGGKDLFFGVKIGLAEFDKDDHVGGSAVLVHQDGTPAGTVPLTDANFDPATNIVTFFETAAQVRDGVVLDFVTLQDASTSTSAKFKVSFVETFSTSEGPPQTLPFNFTATDGDGDAVSGSFSITFNASSTITGSSGNDVVAGGSGDEILIGLAGNDILTGGGGVDAFKWNVGDQGAVGNPAMDKVTDFDNVASSDKLDLKDLLQGEHSGVSGNLANYLHFSVSSGTTTLQISTAGAFTGTSDQGTAALTGSEAAKVDQTVVFSGVDLVGANTTQNAIINNLLTATKLVTDV